MVAIRGRRGLSLRAMSAELERLGHPMGAGALARVEAGERRVDVGDLLALSVALNVQPGRLLLPDDASGSTFAVTPKCEVSTFNAWNWMRGRAPLLPPTDDGSADRLEMEYEAELPASLLQGRAHPARQAVGLLSGKVERVISWAARTPDERRGRGLSTVLRNARAALESVGAELDELEESADSETAGAGRG